MRAVWPRMATLALAAVIARLADARSDIGLGTVLRRCRPDFDRVRVSQFCRSNVLYHLLQTFLSPILGTMELLDGLPQNLQEKLAEYDKVVNLHQFRDASESEKGELTLEQAAELGKEALARAFPDAVREIYRLSQHAASESVKASCAKYITECVIGKNSTIAADDDMKALLKKIMVQDVPVA